MGSPLATACAVLGDGVRCREPPPPELFVDEKHPLVIDLRVD
jgi:hypothetical protein